VTTATSRIQIEQDVVGVLAQLDAEAQLLPVPLAATATAADTTSIRSTTLDRGNPSTGRYDGMIVKILDDTGAGPAVGETSMVVSSGYDGTDKITVSPAFTAAVISGQQFLLYPRRWAPETVVAAIRRVLRGTRQHHLWAPSLIADSDMDSGVLTNWDAVGTPTTREFVTTAANILHGERSLHIITNALTEGASTEIAYVGENETLLVSVPIQVISGSCAVVARNATAGSDLETIATVDDPLFTEVRKLLIPISSDMEELTLRFLSATAASEFYVSPHVIVQSQWERHYAAPSWLESEAQIVDALYLPQGYTTSEVSYAYAALSRAARTLPGGYQLQRSDRDVTPVRVSFANPGNDPVYFLCRRPAADVTTDSGTTILDREYVREKALSLLWADRGEDQRAASARRKAHSRATAMGYSGPLLRIDEGPEVAV